MVSRKTTVFLACALTALLTAQAFATTVLRVSEDEACRSADLIVHATVRTAQAYVDGRARGRIRTHVQLDVHETLLGAPRSTLTLDLPGGAVDGVRLAIPGMPQFARHQEVVLFLERTSRSWALLGMSQGRFDVRSDPSGKKIVRRALHGLHFVAFRDGKMRAAEAPSAADRALADLLESIRRKTRTR